MWAMHEYAPGGLWRTWVQSFHPGPSPCAADLSPPGGNGTVNVDDLLAVINAWGPCTGCAADVNLDGDVDVDDLLAVIGAWGSCP
jgi:hypothetical protein